MDVHTICEDIETGRFTRNTHGLYFRTDLLDEADVSMQLGVPLGVPNIATT